MKDVINVLSTVELFFPWHSTIDSFIDCFVEYFIIAVVLYITTPNPNQHQFTSHFKFAIQQIKITRRREWDDEPFTITTIDKRQAWIDNILHPFDCCIKLTIIIPKSTVYGLGF